MANEKKKQEEKWKWTPPKPGERVALDGKDAYPNYEELFEKMKKDKKDKK